MTEFISFEEMKKRFEGPNVDDSGNITFEEMERFLKKNPSAPQPGQQRFVDKFGITTGLEVGLGMAGGVLGAGSGLLTGPGAPVASPAGALLGGALGTMAGHNAATIARDLEDTLVNGGPPQRNLAEETLNTLKAGGADLSFGLGLTGLGRLGSNVFRFAGKLSGAHSPEVRAVISEASEGGVGVGPIDLDKPFFNIASRVGGVMPIVGGPIRSASETKAAQISGKFISTLDQISPSIDLPKLGVEMTEAATKTLKSRKAVSDAKYERMRQAFKEIGDPAIVPTSGIKSRVAGLVDDLNQLPRAERIIATPTGLLDARGMPITRELAEKGPPIGIPASSDKEFLSAVQSFLDLPDFITSSQLEALQKNLNKAARARSNNTMTANEYRIITDISASTWDALDNIQTDNIASKLGSPDSIRQALLGSIKSAKRSWGDLKALEEVAAAGQLKRVDKNFFSAGFERPGSVEIDELANLYLSSQSTLRSPQFIANLENLIGPKNRKSLARAIIQRAADPREGLARSVVDPSTGKVSKGVSDIAVFDARAMRKKLGIADPERLTGFGAVKQNRQALSVLLRDTGLPLSELDSFLKTVERIQASPIGDPSTFLARRIVLSGSPKSLVPGVTAAAGAIGVASGGLVSLGTFIIAGRAFNKMISTPEGLKLLREGFNPNLTTLQKQQLGIRLARLFPNEEVFIEGERPPVTRRGDDVFDQGVGF